MAEEVVIRIAGQDAGGKALVQALNAEVAKLTKTTNDGAKATDNLGDAGKRAQNGLGGMQKTLEKIALAIGAAKLIEFGKQAIDNAAAIDRMSKQTGVGAEALSVLGVAARQTDTDQQSLAQGMTRLAVASTELKQGLGASVPAFRALGISAKDIAGLSLDQTLKLVADRMAQFSDGAAKSDAAVKIFGRSGADLLPLLKAIANDGFAKIRTEAEKTGQIISQEDAAAADELNTSLTELKGAAVGFAAAFAHEVTPALTDMARAVTETLAEVPPGMKVIIGSFAAGVAGLSLLASAFLLARTAALALVATPVGAALTAIVALAAGVGALYEAEEAEQRAKVEATKATADQAVKARDLTAEYEKETKALDSGKLSAQGAQQAKNKLKLITDELKKLGPEYVTALGTEAGKYGDITTALKEVNKQNTERLRLMKAQLEVEIANEEREDRENLNRNAVVATVKGLATAQDLTPGHEGSDLPSKRAQLDILNAALSDGTTKPPVKPNVPDDTTAQTIAAIKKRIDALHAEAQANEDNSKLEQQQDDEKYAQGLEALDEYYRKRADRIDTSSKDELAILQKEKDAIAKTPVTSPAEQSAKQSALDSIDAQIAARTRAANAQQDANTAAQIAATKQLGEDRLAWEQKIATAQGNAHATTMNQIQLEIEQYTLFLQKQREGGQLTDADRVSIAQYNSLLTTRANFEEQQVAAQRVLTDFDQKRAELQNEVDAHQITQRDAAEQLAQYERERLPILAGIAERMAEIAQASGDPALVQAARDLQLQLGAIGVNLSDADKALADFKENARVAIQDSLVSFLGSAIDQVHGLGDAFRGLALSAVQALQQVIAQLLVLEAEQAILGFFKSAATGGVSSGASTVLDHFATGGHVVGRGSGTSDSIPAMLSNGEFVVRASAVDALGVDFMHMINRGIAVPNIPRVARNRFADGGLVGTSNGSPADSGSAELLVTLGEGLVAQHIRSTGGRRALLQQMGSNPKAFRAVLGLK